MKPVPWYRVWIYTINGLLIFFQLIFLTLAYVTLHQLRFDLFPLKLLDISVIATYVGIGVQFFTCFCGIMGVIFSNRNLIRIYWVFMIPLIAFDFISAIIWAFKFNSIHRDFSHYLNEVIDDVLHRGQNLTNFCTVFKGVHNELGCCPKWNVRKACRGVWAYCRPPDAQECVAPLLFWLHSQIDPLAGILYFLLTPLKMTVVFVLREDMMELLTEIIYRRDPSLYNRHWLSYDTDEENDAEVISSSQGSSSTPDKDSEKSLLQKKRRKMKEPRIIVNPQQRLPEKAQPVKDISISSSD